MFTERVYFCDCVSAKLYPAHCESGALHSARVPIPSKVRNHNAKGELVDNKWIKYNFCNYMDKIQFL